MSDPVTNVEIEDVLSSIRRLVSTDDRQAKPDADGAEASPDKLVLTPSLRVDDNEEEQAKQAEPEIARAPLEEPQEPEATAEPEPSHEPEAEAQMEAMAEPAVEDALDEAQLHESAPDQPQQAEEPNPDSLTAYVAGFEKAVSERDDQWEPDGTDANENNATEELSALPWEDISSDAETEAEPQPETEPDTVPDLQADTPADAPVAVAEPEPEPEQPAEDTAKSFDASETEGLDPFEPEDDDADDLYTAPTESDALEDAASAQPMMDTAATAAGNAFMVEDDLLEDEGGDAVLDEDALRDLVAEIVRQELQGSLGERITRNVRKLVRREIQRALAAQELE